MTERCHRKVRPLSYVILRGECSPFDSKLFYLRYAQFYEPYNPHVASTDLHLKHLSITRLASRYPNSTYILIALDTAATAYGSLQYQFGVVDGLQPKTKGMGKKETELCAALNVKQCASLEHGLTCRQDLSDGSKFVALGRTACALTPNP